MQQAMTLSGVKTKYPAVDYFFWLIIIFYLDPGGFILVNFNMRIALSIMFVLLWLCFFAADMGALRFVFGNKWIRAYSIIIGLWLIYYVFIYDVLNSVYFDDQFTPIIKTGTYLFQFFMVIPIYFFACRSLVLFIKLFSLVTIIILTMYLITVLFNAGLLTLYIGPRGYTAVNRYLLRGYGIMQLAPYFGAALLILPLKSRVRNMMIIAAFMVVLMWILTIVRRQMIAMLMLSLWIFIIGSQLLRLKLFRYQRNMIMLLFSLIVVVYVFFPDYLSATTDTYKNMVEVFEDEATTADLRSERRRMSLTANEYILRAFNRNRLFGTGYNPQWYKGDGGKERLEGSDYVFISCLGMYGIVGVSVFSLYYILMFIFFRKIFIWIKKNNKLMLSSVKISWPSLCIFTGGLIFFLQHLIEYPNWFYMIGAVADSSKFFILTGLLFGAVKYLEVQLYYIYQGSLASVPDLG